MGIGKLDSLALVRLVVLVGGVLGTPRHYMLEAVERFPNIFRHEKPDFVEDIVPF